MQPWTDASPATVGSTSRHPREKRRERANGAPEPPYSLVDQQAPVAGRAQFREHRLGDLALRH